MLTQLQERLQRSDLIIVSDRAGISYDNINDYRRSGAHYLGPLQINAAAHRAQLQAPAPEAFAPLEYRSMNAPQDAYGYVPMVLALQPKNKRAPAVAVNALLLRSARKARQEGARRARMLERCEQRLRQIGGYLNARQYAKPEYARRQLDKALPAALVGLVGYELTGPPGGLVLSVWREEAAVAEAARGDGRYFLVYDLPATYSPDEIFALYRRQAIIEARFRNFNSELSVHPLWLQSDRRIQALLLVFVLALIVYTLLELSAERAGLASAHYHKLTARQMIFQFGTVRLLEASLNHGPPQFELTLTAEQADLIRQLHLPPPTSYLVRQPRQQPGQEGRVHMRGK